MAENTETLRLLLDATAEGLKRELRSADAATEKFRRNSEQHFAKVDSAMGRLDGAIGKVGKGLIGLAAGLSVAALASFTKRMLDAADTLATTADRIGITVESLQELTFAAKRSDTEVSAMQSSLERFTKRVGEAQHGTGELAAITKQYGIAVRDSTGQARTAESVLDDVANAIAGTAAQTERLRIANAAFGKSGGEMVLMLKGGAAGLQELRQQARDAGVVLGNELVRQGAALNDEFDVMGERVDATTMRLTLGLVPALKSASDWFTQAGDAAAGFLIRQFGADSAQGIETLEKRAANLRHTLDALTKAGAADGSAFASTAKRLAEIEAAIAKINAPPAAPTSAPLGDLPTLAVETVDNLTDLQAQLERARQAFDALRLGGTDAYEALLKTAEVEDRAAKSAEAFNKANKARIDSGQMQARGAADYLSVLTQTAELQDKAADTAKLDHYIAKLTDQYGVARDRLKLGEDEAKVTAEINKLREQGIVLSADQEAVIRKTIAATESLNDQWDANQKAIKDETKAAEDAAADRDTISDAYADDFSALIEEAITCQS